MVQTTKQVLADAQKRQYASVYLFTGEENYYIDYLSDYFEQHVVEAGCRDIDQVVVYGNETNMVQVIGLARQFPMMSSRRLVMVKEAQAIAAKDWEPLVAYLKQPQPQTVLVFCYRNKSLDKRSKAYKALSEQGVILDAARLDEERVPVWIANYLKKRNHAITERAAGLIAMTIGNEMDKIANELDKLCLMVPSDTVITEDVVDKAIGISKDYNIYELQTAIGDRNVEQCNRIVTHMASKPKLYPFPVTVSVLYGYFVKLMMYIQLPDKRNAASALHLPYRAVREYERASNNYTLGKLASCIGYLHAADLRSKGVHNRGTVSDGDLLRELVFKIIH